MSSGVPDQRFAEYVVQSKLVTPDQVEEARRSQIAAASIGVTMDLAEALVRMQALTTSQRAVIEQRLSSQPSTGIQQLGPYKLLRRLGAGAMGVVYLAEDTMALREVALKVLARELASNPTFLERFHREAVASGKLNHANLITAYNFGEDRGWRYYVMEYCPGESVEQILEHRGPIPWAMTLRIARDVAQGLHYAHQQGIIHRDVKPGNIMVTPEGAARLLDMGLSKQLLQHEDSRGRTVGTPHYIAPEQARGAQNLDGRVDIYSLGATVFHMLTGRPPFTGKDAIEVIKQHLSAPIPDPARFRADIPERVTRIIQRAMAKDCAQRYNDCAELIAELDLALVAEEPTSAMTLKPSPARQARSAGTPRSTGHPASVWGGGDENAADGRPASVWGDDSSPSVRPAQARAHAALAEPVRTLRSRHASEVDVLSPRPRVRQNTWLWPVVGASAALLLVVLVLVMSGGRPEEQPKTAASGNPTTKPANYVPTLPGNTPEASTTPTVKAETPALPPEITSPPPTAGIDNEDHWKDSVDLMNIVDLAEDPIQGTWRFQGKGLINDGTPRARLGLAYQPPQEYDFRVVFTRKKGDEITQILNWKGTGVAWVLGASGNTASGFLRTNTELTPPFGKKESEGIGSAERHSTIIEVRKDRIRGYLDGKLLSEWSGDSKELTWHPGWDIPETYPLGLGSHNADLVIQSIQVREISGSGKLARKPSALTGPGEITDEWKQALAALPPESQLKHVNAKLQQLNPGYTGKLSMWVEDGELRFINLQGAILEDLAPLHGLPHLNGIGLGGSETTPSPASDLKNLMGLKLAYVDCSYSKVTDLSPLSGMKLYNLVCHHTAISDLSPLKGAPIQKLNCSFTKIQDLDATSEMPLAALDCSGTGVTDLRPLASRSLKELSCAETGISDLAPLEGMPLVSLNVHGTPVKSLAPIAGLPLRDLNVGETKAYETEPLRGLKLTSLHIDGMGIQDLAFLKAMPLEQLNLSGNKVTDLSPLRNAPLTELRLSYNPVSDLSPLKGKAIQSLQLRATKVTSLAALAGAPIHTLDIRGVALANPAELSSLPLTTLFLDYNPAVHAALLKGIKTLERVNYYAVDTFIQLQAQPPKKQ